MNQAPASAPAASAVEVRSPSRALILAREGLLVLSGFAALALIGQISLPLPFTPVPVTLGTLAALGVGGILGSRRGLASVVVFAVAAAAGAPVLAGWTSGVTASFGYVLGYGLAAHIAGRATAATASHTSWVRGLPRRLALMLAASAAVYIPGLIWLHVVTGASWSATLTMGLAPFVVGDALKSVVAALAPNRRG